METFSGGLKGYWKARRAHKQPRRRPRVVHLKDHKPSFRIRVKRRIRMIRKAFSSPKRILARIRDRYVRLMVKLEGVVGVGGGGFPPMARKEYEERVIVEIYKAMAGGPVVVGVR